jgi:hypothetical protein
MQSQGLDQHHVREVLCDQKAARLWLAQLLPHPLQRPAQRRLVRFLSDMPYRRQRPEQDAGMSAGKREVAADHEAIAAAIDCDDPAIPPRRGKKRECVDGRSCQIGRQPERPPMRQQKAVARLQS